MEIGDPFNTTDADIDRHMEGGPVGKCPRCKGDSANSQPHQCDGDCRPSCQNLEFTDCEECLAMSEAERDRLDQEGYELARKQIQDKINARLAAGLTPLQAAQTGFYRNDCLSHPFVGVHHTPQGIKYCPQCDVEREERDDHR